MVQIYKNYWNNEVYNLITNLGSSKVCGFDFDNTLIQNDFGSRIIRHMVLNGLDQLQEEDFSCHFRNSLEAKNIFQNRKQNLEKFQQYVNLEYLWNFKKKGMESAYRWGSFVFQDLTEGELKQIAKDIWKRENGKFFKPYPAMLELIEFLKEKNWDIWIITASSQWCIQVISCHFGIEEEKVLGMQLEIKNQKTTNKIEEPYTFGKGKAKKLKNKTSSYHLSFGDSLGDFELLQEAEDFGVFLYNKNYQPPNFTNVKIQSILHWQNK